MLFDSGNSNLSQTQGVVKIKMNGLNKKVKKSRMIYAETMLKLSTVLLEI